MATTSYTLQAATWTKVLDAAPATRYPTLNANYDIVFETTTTDEAPAIVVSKGTPLARLEGHAMRCRENMGLGPGLYLWVAPLSDMPTTCDVQLD